jgi:hypothetical protein
VALQFCLKFCNLRFHEIASGDSRVVSCVRTDFTNIIGAPQGCEHALQVLQNRLKYFYHLVYRRVKLCVLLKGREHGLRVKLEILTTVNVKITASYDMTPRSLVNLYGSFRGTCFLHIQSASVYSTLKRKTAGPHHTKA